MPTVATVNNVCPGCSADGERLRSAQNALAPSFLSGNQTGSVLHHPVIALQSHHHRKAFTTGATQLHFALHQFAFLKHQQVLRRPATVTAVSGTTGRSWPLSKSRLAETVSPGRNQLGALSGFNFNCTVPRSEIT